MKPKTNTDANSWHRIAIRRTMRIAFDYGGIPLGVGLLVGLFFLMIWCFTLMMNGTSEWIQTIGDPTERGLAYIALAVVFHAFFGKSNIDAKVDCSQRETAGNSKTRADLP